jgi:hypothetical protein
MSELCFSIYTPNKSRIKSQGEPGVGTHAYVIPALGGSEVGVQLRCQCLMPVILKYSGGRDQGDHSLKPAQTNSS